MNKNIITEELSKEIITRFNKAVLNTMDKYYSKKLRCGLSLMGLACGAVRTGEKMSIKFLSNHVAEIKSNDKEKLFEIIDKEIKAAVAKYIKDNEKDIDSLPKVHKNNKKILSDFIHDSIVGGFMFKIEIVSRLMKEAA